VYLTCSKKLTGSQLSLLHGINKKLKCETKNKMMTVIGPMQHIPTQKQSDMEMHKKIGFSNCSNNSNY